MKRLHMKITVLLLITIFTVMFGSMVVSASTTRTITAHNIASGTTMQYYNGNGYSIAGGNYMTLSVYFDNAYQCSAGYKNVTTGVFTTAVGTGTRSSVYFCEQMPVTALYYAWIKNSSSVTMRVTGGTIEY